MPSTTVTLYRGEGVDTYGDPVDVATVLYSGLPAVISEGSRVPQMTQPPQVSFHPADQRGGVVETYTIRLRPTTDAREGDRLMDERTSQVYLVRDVLNPQSVVGMADVRVIAQRVGALSQSVND